MKVILWIHKEDAISGKITKYYYQCPQIAYINYVQIEISQLEFAQMETKTLDQYNGKTKSGGLSPDTGPRH